MKLFLAGSSIPALVLGIATPSLAQEAISPDSAGAVQDNGIEEILVTARKRTESLQQVPLTVTAFSEADLQSGGLNSLEGISEFSPGLLYSEQGSQRGGRSESVIRFRGMDTNDITPTRALASAFVDGIYVAGGLSSISFDEVSRVEVIKGPQSAYFGRTTFGGAINLITRRIEDRLATRLNLTVAQGEEFDVSGSIEGPVVEGLLSARLSGRYYSSGGRYRSTVDGGRLGEESTRSVALSLELTPSDTLDLRFRGFYGEDDDGPSTTFTLSKAYHNCGPFPGGNTTYICGKIPVVKAGGTNTILDPVPYDIYVNNSPNSPALAYGPKLDHLGLRRNTLRASIAGDWEMPIENTKLSFSAAYAKLEQKRLMDLDYTSDKIWLESHFQDIEDKSLELRISQENKSLRWMLGVSYFTLKFTTPNGASIGYLYPNAAFPNGFFLNQTIATDDVKTSAVFGSVSYDFAPAWNLSLEGRYQRDKIDEGSVNNMPLKSTFSNFLPRAILQWTPTNATNLYATYAKGNKPGDFNNNLIALNATQLAEAQAQTGAQLAVGEEELTNYEIGLKQSLFDRSVQINLAAYFMDWRNQQTRATAFVTDNTNPAGVRTVPVIIAAGQTHLWGLEFEGRWRATQNLTLSSTFNYAASEYKDFICGFCQRVVGKADMAGKETPRFPKYSASFSADWNAKLNDSVDWFARGDAIYSGAAWDEAFNLAKTAAFWRVNLRVGVEADRWRAELFVKNLLDDKNYLAAARFTDFTKGNFNLNDFTTNVTPADPRQIGLRFSFQM